MDFTIVDTAKKARLAVDFLRESILIANDVETWPDIQVMSVNGYSGIHADGTEAAFVFPLTKTRDPNSGPMASHEANWRAMQEINSAGVPFTYHNGGYDLFWLTRYRLPVSNYLFDSMTMFWALFPELPKDLAFVSSICLDDYAYWKGAGKSADQYTYLEYNAKDNSRTLHNTLKLLHWLQNDKRALKNFHDAHRRVISCLGMSLWGIRADLKTRGELGKVLEQDADVANKRITYCSGDPDFNFRSPKQLKELFYTVLGQQKRNAKGRLVKTFAAASTGVQARKYFKESHALARKFCQLYDAALAPSKQISNVIHMSTFKGRVYTGYNGVGTTTSRLASSQSPIGIGSNLQNIRKKYRHWLAADNTDSIFVEIDFSAADAVFVAFESADAEMIKVFKTGMDTHAYNVALLFDQWDYESVVAGKKAGDPAIVHPVKGIRQIIKRVSHGANYLMAAATLLLSVGVESVRAAATAAGNERADSWNFTQLTDYCAKLESKYRKSYTRLALPGTTGSWYNDLAAEVAKTQGFTTAFRYFQRFLGDSADHATLRAIAATAGQANTAGRINMAMDELVHGFIMPEFRDAPNPSYGSKPLMISDRTHGVRIALQTHDSFTFHVNRKHADWHEGISRVMTVMRRPIVIANKLNGNLEKLQVGVDVEAGPAWGKALKEQPSGELPKLIESLEAI